MILPEDADNAVEALARADLALYQAKRSGGNKVLRFRIELLRATAGSSSQRATSEAA